MNNSLRSKKSSYIPILVLFFVFGLLIVCAIKYYAISFDGAMNFQVSRSLTKGILNYSTSYIDVGYNGTETTLIDHKVQTGSTVIFPTALLNLLFGIRSQNMQLVLNIYYCSFLLLIYLIIRENTNNQVLSLLVPIVCIPFTYFNPFQGYGEVAMGNFILLSFFLYGRARESHINYLFFLVGIICGFGYLTKTVF